MAACWGKAEVCLLLVKAGAALDLQNKVLGLGFFLLTFLACRIFFYLTLIPSLAIMLYMCNSDLTCVAIAGQIVNGNNLHRMETQL